MEIFLKKESSPNVSHLSFARQMSSLKYKKTQRCQPFFSFLYFPLKVRMGDECAPGDEECRVVVKGMAVVLDVLALLPHAEVVESRGSVEAHCGPFLFWVKHHCECNQVIGYEYCNGLIASGNLQV